MRATTFDSLAAARELKAAGVEGNQAEVFAGWMREASVANQDDFATKADITRLEAHINTVEARLRAEIVATANRNLIATLVALGVMLAVLRLL